MRYQECQVQAIDRWVECIWSLEVKQEVRKYPVRPDGCIDILYSSSGRLEVVGAMTAEKRFDLPAHTQTFGVRFRPGMAGPFVRVPAHELTDCTIPLEDLWGPAACELKSRLAESRSAAHCFHILVTALGTPDVQPSGTQRAVEAITAARGNLDLQCLIRDTGLSERHFRRRLIEETGLSPKKLCRVLRFRQACALRTQGFPWSLVAAQAGYFDQAHLIRDFHDFTGDTPMSVFSNTNHERPGYVDLDEDYYRADR